MKLRTLKPPSGHNLRPASLLTHTQHTLNTRQSTLHLKDSIFITSRTKYTPPQRFKVPKFLHKSQASTFSGSLFLDFQAKHSFSRVFSPENMAMDFWGSRVHSAKLHHFHNSDNHLIMDGDDDVRAWFPCPFCYVEIEIPVLCCHLQEEHCFDLKNAVCPICAANLGKDATAHFTSHHVHSIKRRRKSPKSGFWSNGVSHTREMSNRGNMNDTTPDPLSAFLCNIPFSEHEEEQASSATLDIKSTNEEQVMDHEEQSHRATFVQQLIFSTIF